MAHRHTSIHRLKTTAAHHRHLTSSSHYHNPTSYRHPMSNLNNHTSSHRSIGVIIIDTRKLAHVHYFPKLNHTLTRTTAQCMARLRWHLTKKLKRHQRTKVLRRQKITAVQAIIPSAATQKAVVAKAAATRALKRSLCAKSLGNTAATPLRGVIVHVNFAAALLHVQHTLIRTTFKPPYLHLIPSIRRPEVRALKYPFSSQSQLSTTRRRTATVHRLRHHHRSNRTTAAADTQSNRAAATVRRTMGRVTADHHHRRRLHSTAVTVARHHVINSRITNNRTETNRHRRQCTPVNNRTEKNAQRRTRRRRRPAPNRTRMRQRATAHRSRRTIMEKRSVSAYAVRPSIAITKIHVAHSRVACIQ